MDTKTCPRGHNPKIWKSCLRHIFGTVKSFKSYPRRIMITRAHKRRRGYEKRDADTPFSVLLKAPY